MKNQAPARSSKYEAMNARRSELAEICAKNPDDTASFTELCGLVRPLAVHIMNEHPRMIPYFDREDYLQMADITVWKVLAYVRKNPDILKNYTAYISVSIRHRYISEYRKFVFKNLVALRSFARPGGQTTVSYMVEMEEYKKRIYEKISAYRKKRRKENPELFRRREKEYWDRNKEKKREKDKRYHQKHKRQIAERNRKYRADHREERRESDRRYRAEHGDLVRQRAREYYHRTAEYQRAYRKAYDAAHREQKLAYQKRYYEKNKEKILAKSREYKRKKRQQAREAKILSQVLSDAMVER